MKKNQPYDRELFDRFKPSTRPTDQFGLLGHKNRPESSEVFMQTTDGKQVITEDLVLEFNRALCFDTPSAKSTLASFRDSLNQNWTINYFDPGRLSFTGSFQECCEKAQRYELRLFLGSLICDANQNTQSDSNFDVWVKVIESLGMGDDSYFHTLKSSLELLQLTGPLMSLNSIFSNLRDPDTIINPMPEPRHHQINSSY